MAGDCACYGEVEVVGAAAHHPPAVGSFEADTRSRELEAPSACRSRRPVTAA